MLITYTFYVRERSTAMREEVRFFQSGLSTTYHKLDAGY